MYKGQGHIQRKLMTCAYKEFLVHDSQFQESIPSTAGVAKGGRASRRSPARCTRQCSARAAQNI